jgi:hypothetical protein
MTYLGSSVALPYLLAEDRHPPNALCDNRSFRAGCSNAEFGIVSMRVGFKIRTALPSAA